MELNLIKQSRLFKNWVKKKQALIMCVLGTIISLNALFQIGKKSQLLINIFLVLPNTIIRSLNFAAQFTYAQLFPQILNMNKFLKPYLAFIILMNKSQVKIKSKLFELSYYVHIPAIQRLINSVVWFYANQFWRNCCFILSHQGVQNKDCLQELIIQQILCTHPAIRLKNWNYFNQLVQISNCIIVKSQVIVHSQILNNYSSALGDCQNKLCNHGVTTRIQQIEISKQIGEMFILQAINQLIIYLFTIIFAIFQGLVNNQIQEEIQQLMDAPSSTFNPIKYLLDPKILEKYECVICTQSSIHSYQCKNCKLVLCNQCAIDQKTKANKCPYRCTTSALELQPTCIQLLFICPFSKECKQIMKCVKQFNEHDRQCKFINSQLKQKHERKWQFRCNRNHTLQILFGLYKYLIERRKCGECGQYNISRAICRKCNDYYCSYCRPLPVYQLKCPIGHQFQERRAKVMCYRCDICQLSPGIFNMSSYDDFICNFVICESCMKNYQQFKKPVAYCQNLRNYCQEVGRADRKKQLVEKQTQKHKLIILDQRVLAKCSCCEKQRECYKKCVECKRFYCYKCKIFNILGSNQCQFFHQFLQTSKSIEQSQEQDKNLQCYNCNEKQRENTPFYLDNVCKVTLCEGCYEYHKQYNLSVQSRLISFDYPSCSFGNHTLIYNCNDCYINEECCLCLKVKLTKFICTMCAQYYKYCCACYPTKVSTSCYCERKLKQISHLGVNDNICLICDKVFEADLYGCNACAYTICKGCMISRNEKQVSQNCTLNNSEEKTAQNQQKYQS